MIQPTIGRIVWYHPAPVDPYPNEVQAAIICRVLDDTKVNLAVFGPTGDVYACRFVYLLQEGNERPAERYAEWMPYQIGQAKKTEEVLDKNALLAGAAITAEMGPDQDRRPGK